ncbi:ribonuclease H2 catalytic subunit [Saccharomycopsis crataegensis]|uniref:Ribonuclease n=1 Tax=Saccharomycopsis crataegensis TaxID=43959 RepID=A0AAV5QLV6_9ASCO|nr:ribonuclease H2 catalytic subunit [Saccharomycopsis crataegensis]
MTSDSSAPPTKRKKTSNNEYPPHLIEYVPPTVNDALRATTITNAGSTAHQLSVHDSYTYISSIPQEIQNHPEDEIILGIDEAGRGPVLGSMVYAIAYARKPALHLLSDTDFDDSKKLTDLKRFELLYAITADPDDPHISAADPQKQLHGEIGYAMTNLTARDISSEMLNSETFNNLNNQAHETTIALIQNILKLLDGFKVTEVYIDTVGPPQTYQDKLSKIFPTLNVTVSKKADSIYPIVSAASVVAKVTRDVLLKKYQQLQRLSNPDNTEMGSGYPSDPKTVRYLNGKIHDIFGWNQVIRYSWQTAKTLLTDKTTVVVWEDDIKLKKIDYGDNVSSYFKKKDSSENDLENLEVSSLWYGNNVISI